MPLPAPSRLGQQALDAMPRRCAHCRRTACRCGPSTRSACPRCVRCCPDGRCPDAHPAMRFSGRQRNLPAGLDALADELAAAGHGLIMVMGKGGVGKTTVAAALALGLVQRGKTVHLSTTDPAAHLAGTLNGEVPGLRVAASTRRSRRSATSTRSWPPSRRARRAGAGAAAGRPAVALHRRGGGLPCLLAHRQRGPQCLRGARHRADRPLDAADGRDRAPITGR
jgi:hypothetical protein